MTFPRVISILQRMRRLNVMYVIVTCVIVANLCILFFFYRNHEARRLAKAQASTGQHSHLQIGQLMPRFSTKSLDGTLVDSSSYQGKWILAIYYGAKPNPNQLTHSQALFEKYSNLGFQPLAIVSQTAPEIAEIVGGDISYPIIVDIDHSVGNALQLHGEETGTFLVNPQGEITFSLPDIPNQSSVRQLIERFVVGRNGNQTEMVPSNSLKIGSDLPVFGIKNVLTGIEVGLNEVDLVNASMIFFGADCSACQVSSYLDAIQNISLDDRDNAKFYLVFSRNFSSYDLATRLKSRRLSLSVYVARNEAAELSPDATKTAFGEEAIFISTGGRGQITSITPLTKWLANPDGGGKR